MGYIFESEIEHIKNIVRTRTIGEAEAITLRDILLSRIHPAIKAYFKAEVERNLQQEHDLETRSKKFSYSIPEVISLQHQEDLLLMIHYQFNLHEFDTLLDQAVHFTFNFLCRPQFTLVEFLFENQRRMSTSNIERKLAYCPDYEYYSLLLKRYFTERGLTEISYEEFKALLKRIDAEVVSRHSSQELANMTRAIIGFVEAVQDKARPNGLPRTLPINAAIVFYEDKDQSEIKLRLEYERDHNKLTEIDLLRLAEIIEDVRSITSEHPADRTDGETKTNEPTVENQQPVKVSIERVAHEDIEAKIPTGIADIHEEQPIGAASEDRIEEISTKPSNAATSDLPVIETFLSASEAKKILKSIFHKDKDEYHATLGALDRAGSWEEASLILDDLFLARDVSPQSKAAICLTEKTYDRYKSKNIETH